MSEEKKGFLLFHGSKNKIITCQACISNRVLYCNEYGKEACVIAVLLDQCEVLLEENENTFSLAVTGVYKKKSILRKARRRSKTAAPSITTYYFTANTKLERDEWVEAIGEAGKSFDQASFNVLGNLCVDVIEARDLPAKDFHLLHANSSDPFVVLKIDQQQMRTKTMKRNLNPKWDEDFSIMISHNEEVLFGLVYDQDRLKSESMGQVVLPLSAIPRGETLDVWLPILPRKPSQRVSGKLHLRCKYDYTIDTQHDYNIFGKELEAICDDPELCENKVPKFFSRALAFLESKAINEEGIFRISGSAVTIKDLKVQIDVGKEIDFNAYPDHNCISGVFKLYLRELPNPLLHHDNYCKLIDLSSSKEEEIIKGLKNIIASLPPSHKEALKVLLPVLKHFSDNSKVNKMTTPNLSIVFGPSLIRPQFDSFETAAHCANINILTETLIDCNLSLFS